MCSTIEALMNALQDDLPGQARASIAPTGIELLPMLGSRSTWAIVNAQNGGLLDYAFEYCDCADFIVDPHTLSRSALREQSIVVPAALYALQSSNAAAKSTAKLDAGSKPSVRKWTDAKRERHKLACKDKSKLSLGEKLEIIRLHKTGQTQAQLATTYDKSRSAISKILRPENITRLQSVAETGVEPEMRSYSLIIKNLDLEKAVHQMVSQTRESNEDESRASLKARVSKTFKVSRGWCARFLKRHAF